MKWMLGLAVLCLWVGCSWTETPGLPELHFACLHPEDCASDYLCVRGECVPKDSCASVEICDNGVDDTCDGRMDCEDASCLGKACGAGTGFLCDVAQTCTCGGLGGTPEPKGEVSCSDGLDNDCNGKTDCADSACDGKICASNRACRNGSCTCLATTETSCSDGVDNDCDGKTDCEDPDCLEKACGDATLRPAAYCCGIAPNAVACKDLDRDVANCGACGLACAAARACAAVDTARGRSGTCVCTNDNQCPKGQGCYSIGGGNTRCGCDDDTNCAGATHCVPKALGNAGVCYH